MAADPDKSFSAEDGFYIDQDTGIWIGGGSGVPTAAAPQGSKWFRTSPAEWYTQKGMGIAAQWERSLHFLTYTMERSGAPATATTNANYTTLAEIIWNGRVTTGTPLQIIISADSGSNSKPADFRIFDATNANVIAEVSVTAATRQILNMGTLSNISEGQALWEIQGRRGAGGATAQISSLSIEV